MALKICAYDSKLNIYIDNQNYFRRMKPKVHVFHGHVREDWCVDAEHAPGGKVRIFGISYGAYLSPWVVKC